MSEPRNCRNCQEPLYYGGIYWWHKHNESTSCVKDGEDMAEAEPDNTAEEQVRASAHDLLAALTALRDFMWSEGYADQNVPMAQADAAIAKATNHSYQTA